MTSRDRSPASGEHATASGEHATASAPGKVMLTGEYAVLDGATAVLVAVDRRAHASIADRGGGGPFLTEARAAVFEELLARDASAMARETRSSSDDTSDADSDGDAEIEAARDALDGALGTLWQTALRGLIDRIAVNTDALCEGDRKLGLGSSAAATVATVALACGIAGVDDRELVHRVARRAHASAQGKRGAPGSGADVAACTYGGAIAFASGTERTNGGASATARTDGGAIATARTIALPSDLQLWFAWTGVPADTATLVSAVTAAKARAADRRSVQRALDQIAAASDALATAPDAAHAIAAIAAAGRATQALGDASGVALVPPAVTTLASSLESLGAAAKTTGAGGGDIVVIAAPVAIDHHQIEHAIASAGLTLLTLSLDPHGVTFTR